MPSASYQDWLTNRSRTFDHLESAHRAIRGIGLGGRVASQQILHAQPPRQRHRARPLPRVRALMHIVRVEEAAQHHLQARQPPFLLQVTLLQLR